MLCYWVTVNNYTWGSGCQTYCGEWKLLVFNEWYILGYYACDHGGITRHGGIKYCCSREGGMHQWGAAKLLQSQNNPPKCLFVHVWSYNDEGPSVATGHQGWSHRMTSHAQISTKHSKQCIITPIKGAHKMWPLMRGCKVITISKQFPLNAPRP